MLRKLFIKEIEEINNRIENIILTKVEKKLDDLKNSPRSELFRLIRGINIYSDMQERVNKINELLDEIFKLDEEKENDKNIFLY